MGQSVFLFRWSTSIHWGKELTAQGSYLIHVVSFCWINTASPKDQIYPSWTFPLTGLLMACGVSLRWPLSTEIIHKPGTQCPPPSLVASQLHSGNWRGSRRRRRRSFVARGWADGSIVFSVWSFFIFHPIPMLLTALLIFLSMWVMHAVVDDIVQRE